VGAFEKDSLWKGLLVITIYWSPHDQANHIKWPSMIREYFACRRKQILEKGHLWNIPLSECSNVPFSECSFPTCEISSNHAWLFMLQELTWDPFSLLLPYAYLVLEILCLGNPFSFFISIIRQIILDEWTFVWFCLVHLNPLDSSYFDFQLVVMIIGSSFPSFANRLSSKRSFSQIGLQRDIFGKNGQWGNKMRCDTCK